MPIDELGIQVEKEARKVLDQIGVRDVEQRESINKNLQKSLDSIVNSGARQDNNYLEKRKSKNRQNACIKLSRLERGHVKS